MQFMLGSFNDVCERWFALVAFLSLSGIFYLLSLVKSKDEKFWDTNLSERTIHCFISLLILAAAVVMTVIVWAE